MIFLLLIAAAAINVNSLTMVTGATGRVGKLVVEELLKASKPVLALSRDPAMAATNFPISPLLRVESYDTASISTEHTYQLIHCSADDTLLPALTATFTRNSRFRRP